MYYANFDPKRIALALNSSLALQKKNILKLIK